MSRSKGASLAVNGVTLRFGGLTAVDRVSFQVEPGSITAIIGPNGAGKTSLFNVVSGVYSPSAGFVTIDGVPLAEPYRLKTGLGHLAVMIVGGALLLTFVFAQSLWNALIGNSALAGQVIDWGAGLHRLVSAYLSCLVTPAGAVVAALGAALSGAGAILAFLRQRVSTEVAARRGVARTFQNIRLFESLSVVDTVRLAAYRGAARGCCFEATESVEWYLSSVGLLEEANAPAISLPYGKQRRLEIARCLAMNPSLVLLDEPAAGMNPTETRDVAEIIRKIKGQGITVVLIEHHMDLVMTVADHIVVLHQGAVLAQGSPQVVRTNPDVVGAYLGSGPANQVALEQQS